MLFFSWTLFFLVPTALVAHGRITDQRAWDMAGISLATAMAFTLALAAIHSMQFAQTIGMGDPARRFSIVPLSATSAWMSVATHVESLAP